MKRQGFRGIAGVVLLLGLSLAGCEKAAEEDGSGGAGNEYGKPVDGEAYAPVAPKSDGDEVPSKLAREEGRRPDGRRAPTPPTPEYKVALPIPGKPGYVLNPFTNNPVDVRGIPPGTLVRDPQDPDGKHTFRIPKAATRTPGDGGNGGLTEIPIPEIP